MVPMMSSQVIRNSFSDHKFHSRSKAQMCLKKIIDIIISSSSSSSSAGGYSSSSSSSKSKKLMKSSTSSHHDHEKSTRVIRRGGIDIDLNLRLGLPSEESEEEVMMNKGFSACSGVGEVIKVCGLVIGGDCNSSSAVSGGFSVAGNECDDPKQVANSNHEVSKGKEVVIDEQEFSGITNLPIQSFETEVVVVAGEQSEIKSAAAEEEEKENEVVVVEEEEEEGEKFRRKEHKNEGYLGLLVEAARLISGDFGENEPDDEEEKGKSGVESEEKKMIRNGSKRDESWMLDLYGGFEDISPVVKSKRGRNQVLPYRYRDSVLDPWKRLSRQRSSKTQLHSCTTTRNKQQDLH